jgi:hypothetical protein
MSDVTFFNSVCTKRIINFLLSPDQSLISVCISNVRALFVHIALEGVGRSHETNHLTVGGLPGGGGGGGLQAWPHTEEGGKLRIISWLHNCASRKLAPSCFWRKKSAGGDRLVYF